jgi:hypothetical protein
VRRDGSIDVLRTDKRFSKVNKQRTSESLAQLGLGINCGRDLDVNFELSPLLANVAYMFRNFCLSPVHV